MNNRQVAHIWAQQNTASARGSNFYFDGSTIYSYGPHFPIARFVIVKGIRVVLFTTDTYGNATSKHLCYARNALHDAEVFNVPQLGNAPDIARLNFKAYRERIEELAQRAGRARSSAERLLQQAQELTREANRYRELFCPRLKPLPVPGLSPEFLRKCREAAQRQATKQRQETAKRAAAAAAQLVENIAAWRAGSYNGYLAGDTLLRVSGDEIETSRGARFPIDHAKPAFRVIARCKAAGEGWKRNGHSIHLGHFTIDEIDTEGNVHAGCHFVKWAEIEACAQQLGLLG